MTTGDTSALRHSLWQLSSRNMGVERRWLYRPDCYDTRLLWWCSCSASTSEASEKESGSSHQATWCGEDTGQRGSGHTTKARQELRRQRATIKGEKHETKGHSP